MSSQPPLSVLYPFYPLLNLNGDRPPGADEIICKSVDHFLSSAVHPGLIHAWLDPLLIRFEDIPQLGLTSKGLIRFNPRGLTEWTVVHEMAHAWDAHHDWKISEKMRKNTGSHFFWHFLHAYFPGDQRFWYHVGNPPPPCGVDRNFNAKEDFAESITAFLFSEEAHRKAELRHYPYEANGFTHFHQTPRGVFIQTLFNQPVEPL